MSEFISKFKSLKSVKIEEPSKLQMLQKALSLTLFLAQLILLVQYGIGLTEVFGNTVSLFGAIDLITEIFSTSVLRGLTNAAIGIIYVVLFIFLIKNVVTSVSYFKTSSKGPREQETMTAFIYLLDSFGRSFYCVLLFIVLSRLADDVELTANAVLALIIGCAVSLFGRLALKVWQDGKILQYSYELLCNLLFYFSCILFTVFVCRVSIENIYVDIQYMLSVLSNAPSYSSQIIVETLFNGIIEPTFYIILQIFSLKLVKNTVIMVEYTDNENKERAKRIMIGSIVFISVAFVLNIFAAGRFIGFSIMSKYISIVMCGIAIFLTFSFPKLNLWSEPDEKEVTEDNSDVINIVID